MSAALRAGLCICTLLITLCNATTAAPRPHSAAIEFGVDYYPEDWPAERVSVDARLMQQAGIRIVRLLDTNWERTEPEDGHFDFSWLDRVIATLNYHGIRVILGTSSYVPPAWLAQKHPEIYAVNAEGVRYRWGGMGWVCLNNPIYRKYVARHVAALATHYGHNSGVIGWQIDNELGTWGYRCYDMKYCVPKFRERLKAKFGALNELNRRWVTASYGHRYSAWSQIPLNWKLGSEAHQAPLELEAQRFFSSNITDFLMFQARILHQHTKDQFITHNMSGPSRDGNWFQVAKPLDFLSYDNYPTVGTFIPPGFGADLMRGANHGGSFLVMEERSGYMGPYTLTDTLTPPGLVPLWGWQQLAHGADGILFFRWRMSAAGSEQYWQGLIDYDGNPNRIYYEIAKMGKQLGRVGERFAGARSPAHIALLFSYDSLWALHVGGAKFPYIGQMEVFDRAFRRHGLNVDVIDPGSDLGKYRVVVAPTLHVVSRNLAARLGHFVASGGVLVLTARSGYKTMDNLGVQQPLPGLLGKLAGIRVSAFTILQQLHSHSLLGFPPEAGTVLNSSGNVISSERAEWPGQYVAHIWADLLQPENASVLFRYAKDFYAGRPAVTLSKFGRGKVVYVGALLEPRFYLDLAARVCRWADVRTGPEIPEGVDYAVRRRGDREFRFFINFTSEPRRVRQIGEWHDLLTGEAVPSSLVLPPLSVRVLLDQENR
ncbi:MAG TPA: beta-galactosidase [Bryobacteraceae bacterium]